MITLLAGKLLIEMLRKWPCFVVGIFILNVTIHVSISSFRSFSVVNFKHDACGFGVYFVGAEWIFLLNMYAGIDLRIVF